MDDRQKYARKQTFFIIIGLLFLVAAAILAIGYNNVEGLNIAGYISGFLCILFIIIGISAGRAKKTCCPHCGFKCHSFDVIKSNNDNQSYSTKTFKCPKCQKEFQATLSNKYDIDFDMK